MVVIARIAYLRGLVLHGCKLTASLTVNSTTLVQKVKIIMQPACRIEAPNQGLALSLLDLVQSMASKCHVADKGHQRGNGESEIVFWIDER